MSMRLTSAAFKSGSDIPKVYTCDGDDISPPLAWFDPPSRTQAFALIMDTPSTPINALDHWILYNIPPDLRELEKNIKKFPDKTQLGKNTWNDTAYCGPCPPEEQQVYIFTLFALKTPLKVTGALTRLALEQAMQQHVLETAELTGYYKR
jgi:Raf kinase inhibitor-like YbhB/YbcL family protein